MSAPKKPSRGNSSEPARRAADRGEGRSTDRGDSRPVRKRESATTDLFARHDSSRVRKGDDEAVPAADSAPTKQVDDKRVAASEDVSTKTTTQADAVPKRATSLESAPIGLRKASIPESGPSIRKGADFGELPRPATGTRETKPVVAKRRSDVIAVPEIDVDGTGPRPRVDRDVIEGSGPRTRIDRDVEGTGPRARVDLSRKLRARKA
ncbi:MAG TPA: hypothetical protein VIV40_38420, partial [Kofleriaceae bacterium]